MNAYGLKQGTTQSTWWQRGLMRLALVGVSLSLFACVEINGKADVDAKGHVKVVTTYDFSKVFNNLKGQNPALTERMEGFDCKIFVSKSPNFKCEDEGVLKYKMTDEMDKPAGVTLDEKTGELSFDAVKFFATVTDIKGMVQRDGAQGALIGPDVGPLLPLQSARRQMYQNEGLSIILNTHFADEIVSIDGQEAKNAGHDITINFMDIADKPSYVIVTRPRESKGSMWWFTIGVLSLLGLAIWFLWRKNKNNSNPPSGSGNYMSGGGQPNGNGGGDNSPIVVADSAVSGVAPVAAVATAAAPLVSSVSDDISEEWGAESTPPVDSSSDTHIVVEKTPETNMPEVTEVTEDAEAVPTANDTVDEVASATTHDMPKTDEPHLTRGQRFAQVISAAAVGVGSSAVGSGAHHTVEEVLVHEETNNIGQAIVDEHSSDIGEKKPEQPV